MDEDCRDNRWTASLCTWPPGCSPLMLPPSQEVGSAWASLSLVGCRYTSKACSRETHSPSWASKTYGHNAFQIIHIHTTVINSDCTHTTQHRTHCGLWLRLQSWLMLQAPHHLQNELQCVEWDVKPCLFLFYWSNFGSVFAPLCSVWL